MVRSGSATTSRKNKAKRSRPSSGKVSRPLFGKPLSVSRIKDFLTCERLYYWKHERKLQPPGVNLNLLMGILVHTGIERFYKGNTSKTVWNAMNNDYEAETEKHLMTPLEQEDAMMALETARGMVSGYMAFYAKDLEKYEVLGQPEQWFESPVKVNGHWVMMRGKIDLILRDRKDGTVWVMDHKTASKRSVQSVEHLPIDKQINVYPDAAMDVLDIEKVTGFLYNCVVKPAIRRLKPSKKNPAGESKQAFIRRVKSLYTTQSSEYFERYSFRYNQLEVDSVKRDIGVVAHRLKASQESGDWLRNDVMCSNLYGKTCPFVDLCIHGDKENIISRFETR